jgi:deoxycytidylate deaminase
MSVGINKWRNHPDIIEKSKVKQECSVHAEVDAIGRAGDTKGATLYIARVNNQGVALLSRPCDNCHLAILEAGISKVIYT